MRRFATVRRCATGWSKVFLGATSVGYFDKRPAIDPPYTGVRWWVGGLGVLASFWCFFLSLKTDKQYAERAVLGIQWAKTPIFQYLSTALKAIPPFLSDLPSTRDINMYITLIN